MLAAHNLRRRNQVSGGWLLDGVSLSIQRGDRLAITGPSGSGKTLLLRSLALLDRLDEGEIHWRGGPVADADAPAFRSHVVYLAQRAALFGGSVEDNVQRPFALRRYHDREFDRQRIVAWLRVLDRDESFLAKSQADLSGGEAQIVALLRTLQLDPDVLLLDEPTSALDRTTTDAVEQLMSNWLDAPNTERACLWITHDAEQAKRVGSSALHMKAGRLTQEGRI